jgi:autotransporter-associated beta strand protein
MTCPRNCFVRAIFLALLFGLPLSVAAQTLTITNGIQIYGTLTNTTVTMTGRCELRVMATNNPISGSIINLNSSNAWFFLPNIRPSAVSASYLSQVFVNGVAAVAGSNCRLEDYVMGSVIIPQAPSFTPLQIFSGPNFLGASSQLGLYTYYTNTALGALNRNIGSFRLKRGYMATLAQNTDGTGASEVFVAQDGDLEVGVLSASLNRPVSFVRVFPWRWTAKRGWDDTSGLGGDGAVIKPYWFYDWGNGSSSSSDAEYAPMQWGGGYSTGINSKQKSTELLGFNEPDSTAQANLTVAAAIADWPNMMQSGLRVGAPAVSDSGVSGQGLDWIYSFMNQATNLGYRVDFIPIHWYKCGQSPSQLLSYLTSVYQATGRPIWLTEFNYGANWCDSSSSLPPTPSQEATEVAGFINVLENAPFVERYSIYNWVTTNREMVLDDGVTLTPAGVLYRDTPTTMAYTQTLPAGGSRGIAEFQFETNTLDCSGYGNNGFAVGIPGYTPGHTGQAVALDGANSFIQLPPTVAQSNAFTFAAWVNWDGGANWQRIFDFGNDTSHYLFLTPSSGSGTLRFAINNGSGEQIIETAALTGGLWQHVAVTLAGGSAKIYTNGVLAASSSGFTLAPSNFKPAKNYLGKSQFAADPLFNGGLDEVQIADFAFTAAQIASLLTNSPPQFTTNFMTRGSAAEGVAYSNNIIGTATDPDPGDTLTYSKAGGPAWLNVDTNGILTGTPAASDGGTNYFTMRVTDATGASAFAVVTISTTVISVSGVWSADASGNWSDATKWNGGAVANAAGYTADFSTLNITADRTVTLDTPRSIGALKFSDSSGAQNWNLNSSGGSILTLDTGSVASPSIVVTNTAIISAPLAGVNGFAMTGPGTLILSNANTFTGNTRIVSGTLTVAHTNALQASTVNMDGGDTGTLTFGPMTSANLGGLIGSRNIVLTSSSHVGVALNLVGSGNNSYAGILSGSGSLVNSGSGTFTLTSPNTYTGGTIINAGTVKLSRDPVIRFSFNNAAGSSSGSVITNTGTGGSALNGTIVGTGASVVSGGRYGNALSINGVGGTFANNIVLINSKGIATDAAGTWTLGCWIKTSTAGAVIMYQGDGTWSSSGQTAYLLNANSGSTAGTTAGAVRWAGGFLTGTTALNNGAWHFITLVDRAGVETIYVDGHADTVTSTLGLALSSVANQMWIGGAPDTDSGAVKINGLIDEVFLYNRALNQAEIQLLTNNTPAASSGNFGGQLPVGTALAIASGATFDLGGNSQTVASLADYNGGGGNVTNGGAAPVTLTFGAASGSNVFSGVIADTAATNAISLVKNGAATEVLAGANNFRGTTTVNNGALMVNGSLGTNAVTISGGTSGGNGVIGGPVTVQAGGTLSPGNSTGLLTINNTLTLNGTTFIELNKAVPTNDVIQGISTVNYGGTLTVTNLDGTLVAGDSFTIFYASNYNGGFETSNLPPLGAGLAWNTDSLTNGVLSVVATVPPQFGSLAQMNDGNFQLAGSGAAGVTYELDAATDLTPPIVWSFVTNAVADQNGLFQFADLQATNFPQRFYRIMSNQ